MSSKLERVVFTSRKFSDTHTLISINQYFAGGHESRSFEVEPKDLVQSFISSKCKWLADTVNDDFIVKWTSHWHNA